MSLVPFALRICATRALQAALPSVVAVIDSPQEPLDHLDRDNPQPVIAVYTSRSMAKLQGRNLLGGMSAVLLTAQIYLPESFDFVVSENEVITIDTRRQGAETALDIIWRGAILALNSSPEPWAALWREFVPVVATIQNEHFLVEKNGVRATAREVLLECEPIHEPVPGDDPSFAWGALIELMREDEKGDGLSALADWVESQITGPTALTERQRAATYIGLSEYVARNLRVEMNLESVANEEDEIPLTEAYADPDLENDAL